MKLQLEQRLKELRAEFDSGQRTLGEMEIKQANLRNTLLRISGAIQVLEEELARENQPGLNNIEKFGEIPKIESAAE
jgi:predicted nuclease with TOPRIM domain